MRIVTNSADKYGGLTCLEFQVRCSNCLKKTIVVAQRGSLVHRRRCCFRDMQKKTPFFGQTIQLFWLNWFFVLHRSDLNRDLCRTDYSSFVTFFSLLLPLADVLCLDSLDTFDLNNDTGYRRIEIGEENATVISGKECLDDNRTHFFGMVQAF